MSQEKNKLESLDVHRICSPFQANEFHDRFAIMFSSLLHSEHFRYFFSARLRNNETLCNTTKRQIKKKKEKEIGN